MCDATQVTKLRDQTGCGLMDCKNALRWSEGDWNYAIKILKSMCLASVERPYLWKVAKENYERKQAAHLEKTVNCQLSKLKVSYPKSVLSSIASEFPMQEYSGGGVEMRVVSLKKILEELRKYFLSHTILETEDPEQIEQEFQDFLISGAYCHYFETKDIPDIREMD